MTSRFDVVRRILSLTALGEEESTELNETEGQLLIPFIVGIHSPSQRSSSGCGTWTPTTWHLGRDTLTKCLGDLAATPPDNYNHLLRIFRSLSLFPPLAEAYVVHAGMSVAQRTRQACPNTQFAIFIRSCVDLCFIDFSHRAMICTLYLVRL